MSSDDFLFYPDLCPVPTISTNENLFDDKSWASWIGYFGSDIIDSVSEAIDEEKFQTFKQFFMNPTGGQFDVRNFAWQDSVLVGGIITFFIVLASLIVSRMVAASRKGWMNKVTKHFWFLGHWTFVVAQMAVYVFSFLAICFGSFLFFASYIQFASNLEAAPAENAKFQQYIDRTILARKENAVCVNDKMQLIIDPMHAKLDNITDTVIASMNEQRRINALKKIVDGGSKTKTGTEEQLAIVSKLLEDVIALEKIEILAGYKDEIASARAVLRGIRSQLTTLNTQMEALTTPLMELGKSQTELNERMRNKYSVPIKDLKGRLDTINQAIKMVIDDSFEYVDFESEWYRASLGQANYYDLKQDPWRMYGNVHRVTLMNLLIVPIPVALILILTSLYYCIKMLRRNERQPMTSLIPEKFVVKGFYALVFSGLASFVATYVLFVLSTPLSTECSSVYGDNRYQFTMMQRNMQNRGILPINLRSAKKGQSAADGLYNQIGKTNSGLSTNNLYQNTDDMLDFLNVLEFGKAFNSITANKDQTMQLDSSLVLPIKVATSQLRRNVVELRRMIDTTGILPSSRKVSDTAETVAHEIGVLELKLSSYHMPSLNLFEDDLETATKNSSQPLIFDLETLAMYSPMRDYHVGYNKQTKYNYGDTKLDDMRIFFRTQLYMYLKEVVAIKDFKNNEREYGEHVMCRFVRDPYNGIWVTALLLSPFFLAVALNLLLTAKALSAAVERNEISLVGYFKSEYEAFLDRLNNRNQTTQPFINGGQGEDRVKYFTNPLILSEDKITSEASGEATLE